MRLRKVKNAFEDLSKDTKYFVCNPKDYKGKWNSLVFKNNNPIHIEVGCGKGQFMMGLAQKFPDINFIAIEKFDSVLIRTLEKALTYDMPNLRLVLLDANMLAEVFEYGEIKRIYLNFSDPWPKKKNAKRRLTYRDRLEQYSKVLKPGGFLRIKTDNDDFFDFTLEEVEVSRQRTGFETVYQTRDLHSSPWMELSPQTEYEAKFSQAGKNINFLELKKVCNP
jgi:tRNA (guanine-N7-)-methyltransferase